VAEVRREFKKDLKRVERDLKKDSKKGKYKK